MTAFVEIRDGPQFEIAENYRTNERGVLVAELAEGGRILLSPAERWVVIDA